MGHRWKRWHTASISVPEIDLLSTAFGLPTRRDIKRAERTALRRGVSSRRVYESDESSDERKAEESDCSLDDSSLECDTSRSEYEEVDCRSTPPNRAAAKRYRNSHSQPSSLKPKRNVLARRSSLGKHQIKTTDKKRRPSKLLHKAERSTSQTSTPPRAHSDEPLTSYDTRVQPEFGRIASLSPCAPSNLNNQPLIYSQYQLPAYIPQYTTAYTAFTPPHIHTGVKTAMNQARFFPQVFRFQKLQKLQQELDQARVRLAERPKDSKVHNDLQKVQTELNNMLNSMVALKPHEHQAVSISSGNTSMKASENQDSDAEKENVPPVAENSLLETQSPPKAQGYVNRTLRQAHKRGNSPSCTVRHHLCSGCGNVRSQEFHRKHPVRGEHKPVLNYCSSCREERFDRGIMDRYHFCFGCGKVRSTGFPKKLKVDPGQTIIPNYCGSCTIEVRKLEGVTEQSVVGTNVTNSWQLELDSVASNTIPSIAVPTKPDQINHWPRSPTYRNEHRFLGKRKTAKLHLNQDSLGTSQSAPVSPAVSSPFYPGRRLGSAQRRAQRASTPHLEEDSTMPEDISTRRVDYCAPYAEEVHSAAGNSYASASNTKEGCGRVESDGKFEGASKKAQPNYRDSRQVNERDCSARKTSDNKYSRFGGLHSTNSSGGKTVRCQLFNEPEFQRSFSSKGNIQQRSRSPHAFYVEEALPQDHQARFSKSVFEISGSVTEETPFEKELKHTSRHKSPLADCGPTVYSTSCEDIHQEKTKIDQTENPVPFHIPSSRGAFGRDFHSLQSQYGQFKHLASGAEHISPETSERFPFNSFREENTSQHNTAEYSHSAEHHSVNSFPSSPNSGHESENVSQELPNEGAFSRSVFTDYSRSTNNPYYKPRRPQFPSCDDFRSTWDWRGSGRQSKDKEGDTARRYSDSQFDGRIPEPIVEEPLSPPSSPVQQTLLLEF